MKLRALLRTAGRLRVAAAVRHCPRSAGTITVKGSDTMVILGQRWAEEYMKKNPEHGAAGDGRRLGHRHQRADQRHDRHLRVVARDEAGREGEAARPLQQHRRRDPRRARRPGRLRARVEPADGDLDPGPEGDLHAARSPTGSRSAARTRTSSSTRARTARAPTCSSRRPCSGGADFTPRAQTMPGTAAVVNAVSKEKFGIGYGGAAYAKGIKILKVKKDAASPAINPEKATVLERHATRWRARCSSTCATRRPATSSRSSTGCCRPTARAIVEKVGYYPVK